LAGPGTGCQNDGCSRDAFASSLDGQHAVTRCLQPDDSRMLENRRTIPLSSERCRPHELRHEDTRSFVDAQCSLDVDRQEWLCLAHRGAIEPFDTETTLFEPCPDRSDVSDFRLGLGDQKGSPLLKTDRQPRLLLERPDQPWVRAQAAPEQLLKFDRMVSFVQWAHDPRGGSRRSITDRFPFEERHALALSRQRVGDRRADDPTAHDDDIRIGLQSRRHDRSFRSDRTECPRSFESPERTNATTTCSSTASTPLHPRRPVRETRSRRGANRDESSRKRSLCLVVGGGHSRSPCGERSQSLVLCSSLLHPLAPPAVLWESKATALENDTTRERNRERCEDCVSGVPAVTRQHT